MSEQDRQAQNAIRHSGNAMKEQGRRVTDRLHVSRHFPNGFNVAATVTTANVIAAKA